MGGATTNELEFLLDLRGVTCMKQYRRGKLDKELQVSLEAEGASQVALSVSVGHEYSGYFKTRWGV
jgi:hypothetical protein